MVRILVRILFLLSACKTSRQGNSQPNRVILEGRSPDFFLNHSYDTVAARKVAEASHVSATGEPIKGGAKGEWNPKVFARGLHALAASPEQTFLAELATLTNDFLSARQAYLALVADLGAYLQAQ